MLISILFLQCNLKINSKKFLKLTKILITLCILGVFLKQGHRIHKYHEVRTLIPSDRLLLPIDQKNIKKIQLSENFIIIKLIIKAVVNVSTLNRLVLIYH